MNGCINKINDHLVYNEAKTKCRNRNPDAYLYYPEEPLRVYMRTLDSNTKYNLFPQELIKR